MVEGEGAVEVRSSGMLRDTVVASAVLAIAVTAVAGLLGNLSIGFGLAAGLMLGSANGYAIAALIGQDAPFLAGSMVRLATLTALALLVALVFGVSAWPVALGVGAAQLVMAGVGVRQGLRA
jgi:hypothetical protein